MTDAYTTQARLCDDRGLVSHEPVTDPKLTEREGQTYLGRLNVLRSRTGPLGEHVSAAGFGPVWEPFACTGSAHLAGEHIRCTSPAHLLGELAIHIRRRHGESL